MQVISVYSIVTYCITIDLNLIILILNNKLGLAGIPYSKTEEGVEMIFAVNYLSKNF